jgi:hypothetical protein
MKNINYLTEIHKALEDLKNGDESAHEKLKSLINSFHFQNTETLEYVLQSVKNCSNIAQESYTIRHFLDSIILKINQLL